MKKKFLLRQTLFWDVNPENLDFEKNAQFIIGRVLDFGTLDEWKKIRGIYGLEKIREAARRHIFSDFRSIAFWAIILHLPVQKLKCTRNPSLKVPNAFLMR